MRRLLILFFALLPTACGPELYTVDVTGDRRIDAGYRPGETWRTKFDGVLIQDKPDSRWELWTEADLAGQQPARRENVPAGSTLRFVRLSYLFNSEHPPVEGGTPEMIDALAELTYPDGRRRDGEVVVLPRRENARRIIGTSLLIYPPNETFLERVEAGK